MRACAKYMPRWNNGQYSSQRCKWKLITAIKNAKRALQDGKAATGGEDLQTMKVRKFFKGSKLPSGVPKNDEDNEELSQSGEDDERKPHSGESVKEMKT